MGPRSSPSHYRGLERCVIVRWRWCKGAMMRWYNGMTAMMRPLDDDGEVVRWRWSDAQSRHRYRVIVRSLSHHRHCTVAHSRHRHRHRSIDPGLHGVIVNYMFVAFFFLLFMPPPRDQRLGHIVFVLSVISSFCHSVNVWKCNLDISHEYS